MTAENWLFQPYIPSKANQYCFLLWEKSRFNLKLAAPRTSKLGDYRFRPKKNEHLITINRDLNPYQFLLVYLHEVAHYFNTIKHGMGVQPHGQQWQHELIELLNPMLEQQVFPESLIEAVRNYMETPKAASCSHRELTKALRRYDPPNSKVPLEQLADQVVFEFNQKKYRKLQSRRTRVLCLQLDSRRKYLISKLALVYAINN